MANACISVQMNFNSLGGEIEKTINHCLFSVVDIKAFYNSYWPAITIAGHILKASSVN